MANRVVWGIRTLFAVADTIAPNRAKGSDGTFPSAQHHQQNPGSDHEPHRVPWTMDLVCTAGDFTHDPAGGFDADMFAEQLRISQDHRIKYVIRRDRMFSSYPAHGVPAWTWRSYSGTYHGNHAHVSLTDDVASDSKTEPWRIDMSLNLSQDPDFIALKYRLNSVIDMTDNPKGDDLEPEKNQLAAAILGIAADMATMNAALVTLNKKVEEISVVLAGQPDPEGPTAKTVEAGIQEWFTKATEANAISDFDAVP